MLKDGEGEKVNQEEALLLVLRSNTSIIRAGLCDRGLQSYSVQLQYNVQAQNKRLNNFKTKWNMMVLNIPEKLRPRSKPRAFSFLYDSNVLNPAQGSQPEEGGVRLL